MSKMWKVFFYELKRNIRRRGYLFTTLGVPLLAFVLVFGYNFITEMNQDTEPAAPVDEFDFGVINAAGYVDLSGLFESPPESLSSYLVPLGDEAAAQAALDAGEIDIYYVISADYLETGDVTAYLPALSLGQLSMAERPIAQLVYLTLGDSVPEPQLNRLRGSIGIEEFNLERGEDVVQHEGADFAIVYVFVVMFFVGIIVTNGYLMQSVIAEKENRLIEILISTLRPWQLLTGKVLAMALLGLAQIVIWFVSIVVLVDVAVDLPAFAQSFLPNVQIPWDMIPFIAIYFVMGYLFFAAAYGAVGALSNSMREGPQYAAVFIIPFFLPYYFVPAFVESPNTGLAQIMSIVPVTSPLAMTMRLTISPTVPLGEILLSMVLMAFGVMAMLWLASRLFRVQLLLAGQVPKLRDIPNLIRG